jgi:hypothetical protein
LIRILLLVLVISLVAASTAEADRSFTPSCGRTAGNYARANGLSHESNPSYWGMVFYAKCGSGGTVNYELQRSADGGAHWVDLVDAKYTAPQGGDEGVVFRSNTTWPCSSAYRYRLKVWDANHSTTSGLFGGC